MKEAPLTESWLHNLRARLAPRGEKAKLARHLANLYGGTAEGWQQQLQKILTGKKNPRTETHLAIENWWYNVRRSDDPASAPPGLLESAA